MYYLESTKTDPSWNLALEQYVFDVLGPRDDCFMLWQNDNTIVVGKHQNTLEEINTDYVKEHGVTVVRRLSGGGAVYHDLGNLNFTFVAENRFGSEFDFSTFCRPVVDALRSLGVPAEINGRNDMTIEGRKFSGNAQYMKKGRIMHHGTLMYDSDLEAVSRALNVKPDKIESKGLKSVRSRVTNIRLCSHAGGPGRGRAPAAGCVPPLGMELWRLPRLPHPQGAPGGGLRRDPGPHGGGARMHRRAGLFRGLLFPGRQRCAGPTAAGGRAGRGRAPRRTGRLRHRALFQPPGFGHLPFHPPAIRLPPQAPGGRPPP